MVRKNALDADQSLGHWQFYKQKQIKSEAGIEAPSFGEQRHPTRRREFDPANSFRFEGSRNAEAVSVRCVGDLFQNDRITVSDAKNDEEKTQYYSTSYVYFELVMVKGPNKVFRNLHHLMLGLSGIFLKKYNENNMIERCV